MTHRALEARLRRQRRIGWAYGYGQGFVDGRHDRYDPTPPPDGRRRRSWLDADPNPMPKIHLFRRPRR
jgi:hypothetical protein